MDCQEIDRNELAERYLSGQLDPALQDDFETHILECPRCLQALEALQNVRDDLADRAHQIRSQSSIQRGRFRWHWVVAIPVFVIVFAVGLFRILHAPSGAPLQSQTASNSPPPSESRPDTNTASEAGRANAAENVNSKAVSPAPSAGRSPNRQPAGAKPSPPTSGQGADSSVAKSGASQEAVPPARNGKPNNAEIANVPPGSHDQVPPSLGNNDKITTSVTTTKKPESESEEAAEEAAKERFRLGTVQPPPYTFSGFASAKPPGGKGDKSGLGKALGSPGQPNSSEMGRGLFQKAMDAYLEQRYGAAASLLEDAAQAEPKASDTNFFLGICQLMLAKPGDAVAPLKKVLADEKSPFAQSAHFYLAKAYVQTNNLAEAEAQLQAAAAIPGRLRTEASSMLTRVQALRATQGKQDSPEQHRKPD